MNWPTRGSLLLLVGVLACGGDDAMEEANRLEEVAAAGASVMPFDLDSSTHVFEKTADGGLQQVLSDTRDAEQIALIRDHLKEEAERFAQGDFHDPAMIHGEAMPGLHDLVMGHEALTIDYDEVEAGGQILYSSDDPDLVAALHAWFDAQLSDHGEHAQGHR